MSCAPGGSCAYAQPSAKELEAKRIQNGDYPPNTVLLNVYDIVGANTLLHGIGLGVHHTGVEVYGHEFAFGRCKEGTGVFSCNAKACPGHVFRESLVVGTTDFSFAEIKDYIMRLQAAEEWKGTTYHILRRNCNVFSEFFCSNIVTSPRNMDGVYAPVVGHSTAAASDSSVYTNSPNKENIDDGVAIRKNQLGKAAASNNNRNDRREDNFDAIAHREPPLSATPKENEQVPAPIRRRPPLSTTASGGGGGGSILPQLEPITPNWTNRIARFADTVLPNALINKIENSDRKAQGMGELP